MSLKIEIAEKDEVFPRGISILHNLQSQDPIIVQPKPGAFKVLDHLGLSVAPLSNSLFALSFTYTLDQLQVALYWVIFKKIEGPLALEDCNAYIVWRGNEV